MALVSGLGKIYKTSKPFEWIKEFPPAAEIPPEYQQALMKKWKKELFS